MYIYIYIYIHINYPCALSEVVKPTVSVHADCLDALKASRQLSSTANIYTYTPII